MSGGFLLIASHLRAKTTGRLINFGHQLRLIKQLVYMFGEDTSYEFPPIFQEISRASVFVFRL